MDSPRPVEVHTMGASIPIYFLAIAWPLVARIHAPSDFGGVFLECWSLLIFGTLLYRINSWAPSPARFTLAHFAALLSLFVCWGSTVYAVQMLIPLSLIGFGLVPLADQTRDLGRNPAWLRPFGAGVVLIALPWSAYAVQGMLKFSQFLHLKSDHVQSIQIGDRTWTEPADLEALCQAIHCTTPYSPNHESKTSFRQATVTESDGTVHSFQIARGNRAYSDTAWIQFGVEVYQNRELAKLLDQPRFRSND